MNDGGCVVVM